MRNRAIILFLLTIFSFNARATDFVRFGNLDRQEFSPIRGETFKIPVVLDKQADVKLKLYSVDGQLTKTIDSDKQLDKGSHHIVWDGKDDDGLLVPDEAWVPVISALADAETLEIDPRTNSGGETIQKVLIEYNDHHSHSYQLPAAARVSIRAGIHGGPLLNVLSDWEPHTAGRNIVYWDGFDKNKIINLRKNDKQKLVATAFKLPEYSIITTGNLDMDYGQYFNKKNWQHKPVNMADIQLQRNKQPVSHQYYMPYHMNKSPDVQVELLGNFQQSDDGIPQIDGFVDIRVSMDEASQQAMQGSRYEIGFFINNSFISEEEQGYVPLIWRWKPNNLSPGKHVLTVNVSSFRGQVGVSSLEFTIPEK